MVTKIPAPTPLTPYLSEAQKAEAGPLDVFRLAKRKFLAGERIEMGGLAGALGVSRITLYRWVGTREQLHVEVLWHLTRRTLDAANERVRARGGERVARIVTRLIRDVISNPGMQAWLEREGEAAMRLMTRGDGHLQPRLVDAIRQLLVEEIDAGRLELPVSTKEFAFVIVRLAESYVYRRFITGERSDPALAEPVLLRLLQ